MPRPLIVVGLMLFALAFTLESGQAPPPYGLSFRFKNQHIHLTKRMGLSPGSLRQRGGLTDAQLDTLSNVFYQSRQYVEIVRQDHEYRPTLGLAIGFEFDEHNGEYPYTPAYAVMQLKDFGWGGVEFSQVDTLNYTGVSDSVSDDIFIEVDTFYRDTIIGRYSGLLLSGAGPMMPVDSGYFRLRLYRKK
ncbi:MAG TPA: hypothetical protein PKL15_06825 [Saprospiraceae bacterium]|nr:hypothetical protein [Saprospiraceae bacterium]